MGSRSSRARTTTTTAERGREGEREKEERRKRQRFGMMGFENFMRPYFHYSITKQINETKRKHQSKNRPKSTTTTTHDKRGIPERRPPPHHPFQRDQTRPHPDFIFLLT
jgi:hypothetical protein